MHPSRHYHTSDPATLIQRARDHPFALLISGGAVTHTPVLVSDDGSMRFHISRANTIAALLAKTRRALLVFTGPHAYISPGWYGLPDQVGTWNYTSVEAEGPITALDPVDTHTFLHDLAATFDQAPPQGKIWTDADVSPETLARLKAAITTYRLVPERLEGTTKLSQDDPDSARARVIAQLGDHPLALLIGEV